ncbi:arsenate reductase family protein [uncultured Microscilla sp.]|uniref:arsenate reductase family protein n=1 Tax=uncultured Microscilla sp. TaxID=432653 RepID=UPI0026213968|nr:ArsC/Spx/MgsR family protein [uncultured Microscilla sp.]
MRKKVYYLSTCNTCKRIMSEVGVDDGFEQQNIKTEKITEEQLAEMHQLAGSYEALFSRVSRKYKELGLKDKTLGEDDYKQYILDEYTFLKRPVFIIGDDIFIGNSKKNVAALAEKLK